MGREGSSFHCAEEGPSRRSVGMARRAMSIAVGTLMLVSCLVRSGICAAQGEPGVWRTISVGYLGAIPKQPIGLTAMTINRSSVGMFFGLEMSIQIPKENKYDFAPDLFSDPRIGERDEVYSVNGGVTKKLGSGFAVFGGLGGGYSQPYVELNDPMQILAGNGHYWVKLDAEGKTIVYALGGIWIRGGRTWAVQIGAQTDPGGVVGGLSYLLDLND